MRGAEELGHVVKDLRPWVDTEEDRVIIQRVNELQNGPGAVMGSRCVAGGM